MKFLKVVVLPDRRRGILRVRVDPPTIQTRAVCGLQVHQGCAEDWARIQGTYTKRPIGSKDIAKLTWEVRSVLYSWMRRGWI